MFDLLARDFSPRELVWWCGVIWRGSLTELVHRHFERSPVAKRRDEVRNLQPTKIWFVGGGFLIRQNIHDDVNCCWRIRNDETLIRNWRNLGSKWRTLAISEYVHSFTFLFLIPHSSFFISYWNTSNPAFGILKSPIATIVNTQLYFTTYFRSTKDKIVCKLFHLLILYLSFFAMPALPALEVIVYLLRIYAILKSLKIKKWNPATTSLRNLIF